MWRGNYEALCCARFSRQERKLSTRNCKLCGVLDVNSMSDSEDRAECGGVLSALRVTVRKLPKTSSSCFMVALR